MITLRPYQSDLADNIRRSYSAGNRSVLAVSPTGSGKTVLFSYIASSAQARGNRVMILAHRAELLDQISQTLARFSVRHAFIAPGYPGDARLPVQVASVFAVARRLGKIPAPDLIVLDEAHHGTAGSWRKILDAFPNARVLGVTATPCRTDGAGLGDVFSDMVIGPTVAELIKSGSLSRYRLFAPSIIDLSGVHTRAGDYARNELAAAADKPKITGDAITHYRKLSLGKRAVVFCVSVEHAMHVAASFRGVGIPAAHMDGGMERAERNQITRDFTAGRIQVLTSCDLISEGFDLPAIEVAILLRPTQSLGLYLQQVGRALRTFDGKTEALILDHAGNAMRHGLPDDDREWSLDGARRSKRDRDPDEIGIRQCPKCFRVLRQTALACECGHVFAPKPREVKQEEGELQEVDIEAMRRQARQEVGKARTLEELKAVAAQRGYKPGWAEHVYRSRMRA